MPITRTSPIPTHTNTYQHIPTHTNPAPPCRILLLHLLLSGHPFPCSHFFPTPQLPSSSCCCTMRPTGRFMLAPGPESCLLPPAHTRTAPCTAPASSLLPLANLYRPWLCPCTQAMHLVLPKACLRCPWLISTLHLYRPWLRPRAQAMHLVLPQPRFHCPWLTSTLHLYGPACTPCTAPGARALCCLVC